MMRKYHFPFNIINECLFIYFFFIFLLMTHQFVKVIYSKICNMPINVLYMKESLLQEILKNLVMISSYLLLPFLFLAISIVITNKNNKIYTIQNTYIFHSV